MAVKNVCCILLLCISVLIVSCGINPDDVPKYGLSPKQEFRYDGTGALTGYTSYIRSDYGYLLQAMDYNSSGALVQTTKILYNSSWKTYIVNTYNASDILTEYKVYLYDSGSGFLTQITYYNGGGSVQSSITYSYNANGLVNQRKYFDSGGGLVKTELLEYEHGKYPTKMETYNSGGTLTGSITYKNAYHITGRIQSIYTSTGSSTIYYYIYYGSLSKIDKYDNSGILYQTIVYKYG